jgi:hypothetical protein
VTSLFSDVPFSLPKWSQGNDRNENHDHSAR